MKVIVTGATGFVGREIVVELNSRNCEIFQVGKSGRVSKEPNENFFRVDITDAAEVGRLKILGEADVLIHAAGLAHQFGEIDEEQFRQVNVEGTKNMLALAAQLKIGHFILISSTAVYGTEKKTNAEIRIIDETADCRPQTFYAESKLRAEEAAIEICGRNNIQLTIFRLAPVIGEGNAGNAARMIEAIRRRRFIWIGSGENYKSLIYKRDVGRACAAVLADETKRADETKGAEIFNLAAEPILMRDFVGGAAKKLNKRIPNFSIPPALLEKFFQLNEKTLKIEKIRKIAATVEKWLSDDVYSNGKFRLKYDFEPSTAVSEALEKQIDWFQKQKETGKEC